MNRMAEAYLHLVGHRLTFNLVQERKVAPLAKMPGAARGRGEKNWSLAEKNPQDDMGFGWLCEHLN